MSTLRESRTFEIEQSSFIHTDATESFPTFQFYVIECVPSDIAETELRVPIIPKGAARRIATQGIGSISRRAHVR